jgi:protein-cysteine N-palmitoyltransferase HHAT
MLIPPGESSKSIHYWKQAEMIFALLLAVIPISLTLKDAFYLSKSLSNKYSIAGIVKSPWYPGMDVDLNDGQLTAFLEGLPLLIGMGVSFVTLRKLLQQINSSLRCQLWYYVIFGISYAGYLHGPGVIYILAMVLVNYILAVFLAGLRGFPLIVWVGNISFLVLTEYYDGYKFSWMSQKLEYLDRADKLIRWHTVNNLCMLKVISYLIDYHWKISNKIHLTKEKHAIKCDECKENVVCLKFRMENHANNYSLLSFIGYTFYPPLYLAGPTLTYNAWISQVQIPQQTYDYKRLLVYLLRLLMCFILLMWFIHNLYFPTIANNIDNRKILDSLGPYELIAASYFILNWIWLKFTVIWRFFRIWALFDGIESPENMGRCMSNNYCFEGFWRMWHRAFNQWLVRYLFIPLGGSRYKILNIWIVFGFVALWHDLSLNLLAWGWGMCIFIMPEVLVKSYMASEKMAEFRKTLKYSWICAICGGFYICLMIMANLVGFSFGLSGLKIFVQGLMNWEGAVLVFKSICVLTMATHFMIMYRDHEVKRGVKDKGY